MNFHISPLSPLRPRYPTTLGPPSAARPPGRSDHQHDQQQREREPDDDDQDDGTDTYHLHLRAPRTPVGRTTTLLGRPKIEVDGPAAAANNNNNNNNNNSSSGSGSDSSSSDSSGSDDSAEDDDDDVTQDSRDVLVQRLNDLAQRLSAANVKTGNVEALHAQVDKMERVLSRGGGGGGGSGNSSSRARNSTGRRPSPAAAAARRRGSSLQPGPRDGRWSMALPGSGGGGVSNGDAHHGLMGPPLSPSWLLSQLQRQPSISIRREDGDGVNGGVNGHKDDDVQIRASELHKAHHIISPPIHLHPSIEQPEVLAAAAAADDATNDSPSNESYEMADTIVQEAEGLCAEMASVIASLQKRREESDHIHAVLVQREGAADKLILKQATRIGELEDTVAEDESELRYLKIQLRGIEAQCLGYIPEGADPELDQSIRSWKKDWTSLRDRWATRKGSSFMSGDDSSMFSNSTGPAAP